MVVHNGFASSGHYYSLIKDREKKSEDDIDWIEFNDSLVRPYHLKNLNDETFGQGNRTDKTNKFRNAYILFYERETKYRHVKVKKVVDEKTIFDIEVERCQSDPKVKKEIQPLCVKDRILKHELEHLPKFLVK